MLYDRCLLIYVNVVKSNDTENKKYGRRVIQPIVSRCTITRDLEIYYEG